MNNFAVEKDGKTYWVSRSVAAVVNVYMKISGNWCILANKRGPGLPNNAGLWNCPSGYIDYDETIKMGAIREVQEETGIFLLNYDGVELMEVDDNPAKENQTILFRYRYIVSEENKISGYLTDKYSEPNEIENLDWIPIEQVHMLDWTSDKHMNKIYEYAPQEKEKSHFEKFWESVTQKF